MHRCWTAGLACTCLAALWWTMPPATAAEETPAPTPQVRVMRIGTFAPRDVALAYYRSNLHNERLKAMIEEHKKAKLAGDNDRVKHLEAEGKLGQEEGHRQVFGIGPYDSLIPKIQPILPAVAKAQNVDAIVMSVYFAAPGVETVDVTDAILTELKADEKTRKMVEDLREKVRSGQYKPEEFKGEH